MGYQTEAGPMTAKLSYIRPLGQQVPVDADAIEAYHRDLTAEYAWQRRWKLIGAWLGFVAVCALCWYGILYLAYKATEGR